MQYIFNRKKPFSVFDMITPLEKVLPERCLCVFWQWRYLVLVDVLQHPLVGAHDLKLSAVDDQDWSWNVLMLADSKQWKNFLSKLQSNLSITTTQGRHKKRSLYTGGRYSQVFYYISSAIGIIISGRCRQVVALHRWSLTQVWLYYKTHFWYGPVHFLISIQMFLSLLKNADLEYLSSLHTKKLTNAKYAYQASDFLLSKS